ncbi:hypothetical protein SPRG_11221 [Saprolegnia parasitica CBS 223.65]|uniref:Protein phosphatase inhibitor 2 n=1 Tax=Saprolegnia parasitica (strain CBS 223.65) TaxID=695850 RepID=A0A067CB90_SAPPC|nr:hypothetical protein SPRG_11221 [Saprolegnia parasitica CBS 223.65]KDO23791.1 hypothetical protein SPRG_11221 [Saprolegnia parasitica CBS 223.65]|eukprot:XP_012205428.1 hypothetical protein SPRG_11221 [Saprolegnia parasitica CBS 223.65]
MADAPTPKPRIQWDEETIALHDLDRGTRMKINEPNTPYHYYEAEEDHGSAIPAVMTDVTLQLHNADPVHAGPSKPASLAPISPARSASNGSELKWDELETKLKVQEKRSEWDSDSDSASPKKKDFSKKRKQHYNEYEMMKQWRQQHQDDGDDDEE